MTPFLLRWLCSHPLTVPVRVHHGSQIRRTGSGFRADATASNRPTSGKRNNLAVEEITFGPG